MGAADLYAYLDLIFLTEFINIVLVITNIMERITKIAKFNEVGNSTPLYEENFTIVESNTAMAVKIKMMISDFFLVRFKVARLIIFSFTLQNRRRYLPKCL
jgi:hypothetical protein